MTISRQLPLIPPAGPAHQPTANMLRLLVFNAQHASPSRARRQAEWIASQETADLVILTEVGAGPGGHALVGALSEHGYPYVLAPEPALPDYRTVLASRGVDLSPVPSGIDVFPHRGVAAAVSLAGHTIGLLGLYVPSRGPQQRRNQNKRAFQQAVTRALPGFAAQFGGPVIIAGDLNIIEPGHTPHHRVCRRRDYRRLPCRAPVYRRSQLVRPQRPGLPLRPHVRHQTAQRTDPQLRGSPGTQEAGPHRPRGHGPNVHPDPARR